MPKKSNRRSVSFRRRGSAAVELAVSLPLFVLVILGSFETCSLIYLQESLCVASYEAARLAVKPGASQNSVAGNTKKLLDARGIEDFEVDIQPKDLDAVQSGDTVSISLSVPAHANSLLPQAFFGERTVQSHAAFVKE